MSDEKLRESIELLGLAIRALEKKRTDSLNFAAASKAYEVVFEYAWKDLKREADQAGYETYNPRDVLRAAAEMKLIKDLEMWKQFLNARNLSVHDYLGIDDMTFMKLMKDLFKEASRLFKPQKTAK